MKSSCSSRWICSVVGIVVVALLGVACATAPVAPPESLVPTTGRLPYTELSADLFVEEVADGVVRFVSFKDEYDRPLATSGLLVLAARGAVLIDTPWTNDQTKLLADWNRKRNHREIREVVITHAHADRFGGATALAARGATVRALPRTIELAAAQRWGNRDYPRGIDAQELPKDATLELAGEPVTIFFPGAAHAPDNVVVWLAARRVLFGGCMVRALGDADLGKLDDANPDSWRAAIGRVIDRYPTVEVVVPGHGDPGDRKLLVHTRALVIKKAIEPPR